MPSHGAVLFCAAGEPRSLLCRIAASYGGVQLTLSEAPAPDQVPLGRRPALRTGDGALLWDAAAAALHLAPAQLRGAHSPAAEAAVLAALFQAEELLRLVSGWLSAGAAPQQAAASRQAVLQWLERLDAVLRDRTYLVGERVSLADVALCCALLPAFTGALDARQRGRLVCVTRWFRTVVHQPAAAAVLGELTLWDGAGK